MADVPSSLKRLRAEGLARHYVASNWPVARLREARAAAAAEGWAGFVASQVEWSLAARDPGTAASDLVAMDGGVIALHEETGWAAVPYSAQAEAGGGLGPATAPAYDDPRNRGTAALLGGIAARHGAMPTQVMLAAFRRLPFPAVPVFGPRDPGQLLSSWATLSIDLGAEDEARLSALALARPEW